MSKVSLVNLLLSIPLTLVSCDRVPDEGARIGEEPIKLYATVDSIQKTFVNNRCLACHKTPTALNRHVALESISNIIEGNGPSHTDSVHIRKLIKPGCPKKSLFASILREGKMPPKSEPKIEESQILIIEEWIKGLAPTSTCDDGEPPDGDVNFISHPFEAK